MIENSIRKEFSAPYPPHQNWTAERSWRTLFDMTRCLLFEAKLQKSWWPHALKSYAYIHERFYNPQLDMTAYEVITGLTLNLQTIHIFGRIFYAYVQDKGKLDSRSEEGIFIGYDMYIPAFIIYLRRIKFTDKFKYTEYGSQTVSSNNHSAPSLFQDSLV